MAGAYATFTHITDYMGLEGLLTDEERMIRESARKFVNAEVLPIIEQHAQDQTFPAHLIPKMGELGFYGPSLPEEYGCLGVSNVAYGLLMYELERGDSGLRSFASVQGSLVMWPIHAYGSEEQKRYWLPRLATGEKVGCFGLTEPDFGSNPGGMRTRAVREAGGRWRLNGTKMWITNGPYADVLVVYAKTAPEKKHQGITAFLVEKSMPGFSTSPKLNKLGMRGSPTCELVFNNCAVPQTHILGRLNGGVDVLMSGLNYERLVLAGGPLGIMAACMDVVLPYIHERRQFGRAIGEFELMQGKLADMYATWNACRSYVYTVAKAADSDSNIRKDAAAVILYAAEKATWMALEAIQCLGGNGYINDFPTGRLLRDAKLYEIGAGTSEVRRMLIGRELFRDTAE